MGGEDAVGEDVLEEDLYPGLPQGDGTFDEGPLPQGQCLGPHELCVAGPGCDADDNHHVFYVAPEQGDNKHNQEEGGDHQKDIDDLRDHQVHLSTEVSSQSADEHTQHAGNQRGDHQVLFKYILPNGIFPVIANTTRGMAGAILTEASLSFLGLGDPNIISWGQMIYQGKEYITSSWWVSTFSGVAIIITVIIFYMLGDGLNHVINPKYSQGGKK